MLHVLSVRIEVEPKLIYLDNEELQELVQTHPPCHFLFSVYVKLFTKVTELMHCLSKIAARNRVPKCDVIILQILPFEPLNLIMRYAQQL